MVKIIFSYTCNSKCNLHNFFVYFKKKRVNSYYSVNDNSTCISKVVYISFVEEDTLSFLVIFNIDWNMAVWIGQMLHSI